MSLKSSRAGREGSHIMEFYLNLVLSCTGLVFLHFPEVNAQETTPDQSNWLWNDQIGEEGVFKDSSDRIIRSDGQMDENETLLSRNRRDAPGNTPGDVLVVLNPTGSLTTPSTIEVGLTLSYSLVISFPTITAMTTSLELNAYDLESGTTTLSIVSFRVVSVGSRLSSSLGDLNQLSFKRFQNPQQKLAVDRITFDLGAITNTDTVGSVVDGSKLKIDFQVMKIGNPALSTTLNSQEIAAALAFDNQDLIWTSFVSVDGPAPNYAQTLALSSEVSSTATTLAQSSAQFVTFSLDVTANRGILRSEFFLESNSGEDVASLGGMFVSCGPIYFNLLEYNTRESQIEADSWKTYVKKSENGKSTIYKLYQAIILQEASSGLPVGSNKLNISIAVYATDNAKLGSSISLHANMELTDGVLDNVTPVRSVNAIQRFDVSAGNVPAPSGTVSIHSSMFVSVEENVHPGSTILYDVVLSISSNSYIALHTLTLGLAAIPDVSLCNIQVHSQGSNIIHVETSLADEADGTIELKNIHTDNMATNFGEKANHLIMRLSLIVLSQQSLTLNPGGHNLPTYQMATAVPAADLEVTSESVSPGALNLGQNFALDLIISVPNLRRSADAFSLAVSGNPTELDFKFCGVQIQYVGKDLACFENVNTQSYNGSSLIASLTTKPSSLRSLTEQEDRSAVLRAIGQIMPTQTSSVTSFSPSAGVTVGSNKLYVMLTSYTVQPKITAYAGDDPIVTVLEQSTVRITHTKTHFLRVSLVIPKGAKTPAFSLKAASDGAIRVDRVILLKIGSNHACLSKELVEISPGDIPVGPSYERSLGVSSTVHLGPLDGLGSSRDKMSVPDPAFVTEEQILLGVAVQSFWKDTPTGDVTSSIQITGFKDQSQAIPAPLTISVTASGVEAETVFPSDDFTMKVQPYLDNFIRRDNFNIIKAVVTVPASFYGRMKLKCSRSNTANKKWSIEAMMIQSKGENIFGVWLNDLTSTKETTTVSNVELVSSITLNIHHITQHDVVEPTSTTANYTEANTITGMCVVKASDDTDLVDGNTITTDLELRDHADQLIRSDSIVITYTDAPAPVAPTSFDNSTLSLEVLGTPYAAYIGQTIDVVIQLQLPPGRHNVKVLAVGESSTDRTKIRPIDMLMGSHRGAFLIGLPSDTEGRVNRSKHNANIVSQSDTDSILVDLGTVINLGEAESSDMSTQKFDVIARVQISDNPEFRLVTNPTSSLQISCKLGKYIITEEVTIAVSHATDDKAVIETTLALIQPLQTRYDYQRDQKVGFTLEIHHSNDSKREAEDARGVVIFPPYMVFENGSESSNSTSLQVLHKGSSVALVVGQLLFTDKVRVNFSALIDPNSVRSPGSGWAKATTLVRAICRPSLPTAVFERCGPVSYAMYEVNAPGCSSPLLASLDNCHFSASSVIEASSNGAADIKLSASGWLPAFRGQNRGIGQYVQVNFGRKCFVSGWQATSTANSNAVTQISLMKMVGPTTFVTAASVNITANMPMQSLEEGFNSESVRIVIEATANVEGRYTDLQAELYGCCDEDSPATFNCTGPSTATVYSDRPYKWRHFDVDPVNNFIYFCDYNLERDKVSCFSSGSTNGTTWTALPPYVASLRGHSSSGMYIYDSSMENTLKSTDGVHWTIVANSSSLAPLVEPSVLPGRLEADTTPVEVGGWTGDYFGLKRNGVYYVRWD